MVVSKLHAALTRNNFASFSNVSDLLEQVGRDAKVQRRTIFGQEQRPNQPAPLRVPRAMKQLYVSAA